MTTIHLLVHDGQSRELTGEQVVLLRDRLKMVEEEEDTPGVKYILRPVGDFGWEEIDRALRYQTCDHTTEIDGYKVELTLYTEGGEPRSDCNVSKGNFSSSLARLEDMGTLYHDHDKCDDIPVDANTTGRISQWAEDNGY